MLLITTPGFIATTWQQALPGLEVFSGDRPENHVPHDKVVWVISQIDNWQQLVLKAVAQNNQVIVLSRFPDIEEFKQAFSIGAHGYLDALANKQILQTAFQGVKAGGLWIPEDIVNSMIGNLQPKISTTKSVDLHNLTDAERKVAGKVALGESNKEVAEHLNVSERTIKSHLTSIYHKLNLRDRMHLMLYMQGQQ